MTMNIKLIYWNTVYIVLVLLSVVLCKEHTNHGPRVSHTGEDGDHSDEYDHQAVLGSEDLGDEFDQLPPEEARKRLRKMVEQHDLNGDGQISKEEMYKWITGSFLNLDREESMEKFEEEDGDSDGLVSWSEYLTKVFSFSLDDIEELRKTVNKADQNSDDEIREAQSSLKMVDEDYRFFQGADQNGDGSLNPEEYMAFFFPHNFDHMHKLELERYMDQNDMDGDGRISMSEFIPEGSTSEAQITSEENFAEFDKDKDGFLTPEELKEWVVPGTDELAEDEGNHLFGMADVDRDGLLSMNEILDKTEQFVGSSATDYGNFLRHDEL